MRMETTVNHGFHFKSTAIFLVPSAFWGLVRRCWVTRVMSIHPVTWYPEYLVDEANEPMGRLYSYQEMQLSGSVCVPVTSESSSVWVFSVPKPEKNSLFLARHRQIAVNSRKNMSTSLVLTHLPFGWAQHICSHTQVFEFSTRASATSGYAPVSSFQMERTRCSKRFFVLVNWELYFSSNISKEPSVNINSVFAPSFTVIG